MRKLRRDLRWDFAAWQDFQEWYVTDKAVSEKIVGLLAECLGENPFRGTGQPEPLKHNLHGFWSRRINREHRLVYEVSDQLIYVLQCKTHYQRG